MTKPETNERSRYRVKKGLILQGADFIHKFAANLPRTPGVYRMLDEDDAVLYVGKAKSLRARVMSYTRVNSVSARIKRMIAFTRKMEVIHTTTETEALLLEANLIKQLKPRYNVLLRDDKSFPYINLTNNGKTAPALYKHRGSKKGSGKYFGPFASAGSVNVAVNALQKAFLLRTCSESYYLNRVRPCMLYQVKRCSGPCTGEISKIDYAVSVDRADRFLSGKSHEVIAEISREMQLQSDGYNFEYAAVLRDRLKSLTAIQAKQDINPRHLIDGDVFALARRDNQVAIQVFFFRMGQNWGNVSYFPRVGDVDSEQIFSPFLAQFYLNKPIPPKIIVDRQISERSILEQALSEQSGRSVKIIVPERGEKKSLIVQAQRNAENSLALRISETVSNRKLLEGLAEVLSMDVPRRIEVYDNSHIQGTSAVGAMVVAGQDGFDKSSYRKFNIKLEHRGDDLAMMHEVLTRRLARLPPVAEDNDTQIDPDGEAESDAAMPGRPDLLLIDGGITQLSVVQRLLDDAKIDDIKVASVSKGPDRNAGREKIHLTGQPVIVLEKDDPVLYYVQRLRDEVHRFAIGTHRALRKKRNFENSLDAVDGVGPTRKKALMLHFGSVKSVAGASVRDLMAVDNINHKVAQRIYDFFQQA